MLWRFNMKHFRRNIHRGISIFFFFVCFFGSFWELIRDYALEQFSLNRAVTCLYNLLILFSLERQVIRNNTLLVNGCDHHGNKLLMARDKVTSLRKYKVGHYKRKYWVYMAFCCIWNESNHVPGSIDDASWWNLTLNSAFFAEVVF